ncbi:hypothetical protein [Sphingomonas dokdonensis]|nr:hypothetical protein [Sphingomonas dokdonensis]
MESLEVSREAAERARRDLQPLLNTWIGRLNEYPGFGAWKREALGASLDRLDIGVESSVPHGDFYFDAETERQHRIVSSYYALWAAQNDIRDSGYYFRRFPFSGLPVTKASHLRMCCELYFNRIHHFRERWRAFLKVMKRSGRMKALQEEHFIEALADRFSNEIAARNRVHHEAAFDDPDISALTIAGMLARDNDEKGWGLAGSWTYRRACKVWVRRVEAAAMDADLFIGVAATLMLASADFLKVD